MQSLTSTPYVDFYRPGPAGSHVIHARTDHHHDGVTITVAHSDALSRDFHTTQEADTYLAFLEQQVAEGHTLWQIEQAAGVLTSAAAAIDELTADLAETAEVIHLRPEFSRGIACGATGPVRITRIFNDVTCQACIDAEDRRLGRRDDTLDRFRQATTRRAAITTEPQDRVLAQADANGYIRRGKTASIVQLNALDACGLVKLDRRKQGRHWVTFGATLTAKAGRRVAA